MYLVSLVTHHEAAWPASLLQLSFGLKLTVSRAKLEILSFGGDPTSPSLALSGRPALIAERLPVLESAFSHMFGR